jgi:hypothetical protein
MGGVVGGVPMLDERVRREVTQPSAVPAEKEKEVTCLESAIRRWSFPASTGRTVLLADLELAGGHWKLAKLVRAVGPLPAADLDRVLKAFATALSCQSVGSTAAVTVEITVGADGKVLSVVIR